MRKEGFYWIKLDEEWMIAKYFPYADYWGLCGTDNIIESEYIQEILEEQILPPDAVVSLLQKD